MPMKTVAVTAVEILDRSITRVTFNDGVTRVIDLRPLMRGPLLDAVVRNKQVEKVKVDAERGTLVWANGAVLDPAVLRFKAPGIARPRLAA